MVCASVIYLHLMKDLGKNEKGYMHCDRHEITLTIYMTDSFLNNLNNQIVLLLLMSFELKNLSNLHHIYINL